MSEEGLEGLDLSPRWADRDPGCLGFPGSEFQSFFFNYIRDIDPEEVLILWIFRPAKLSQEREDLAFCRLFSHLISRGEKKAILVGVVASNVCDSWGLELNGSSGKTNCHYCPRILPIDEHSNLSPTEPWHPG